MPREDWSSTRGSASNRDSASTLGGMSIVTMHRDVLHRIRQRRGGLDQSKAVRTNAGTNGLSALAFDSDGGQFTGLYEIDG